MMRPLFPYRLRQIDAERRLCHANETLRAVGEGLTDWTKWGLEQVTGAGVNIREKVKALWNADVRSTMRDENMQNISQFFHLASPDMLRFLDDRFKNDESINSLTELADLLDHSKWIDAFSYPDLFDESKVPMQRFTMHEGPRGVLLGIPVAERKRLFAGYVDRYIPQKVQKNHVGVFGPDLRGAAHEDAVVASAPVITNTMRDMLGMLDTPADPESRAMAVESLESRYEPRVAEVEVTKMVGGIKVVEKTEVRNRANLHTDFDKATGGIPIYRDIRELQDSKTPSLLRGAAKLGVLHDEDIAQYAELARNLAAARQANSVSTHYNVEQLEGVTKREIRREAQTMSDVWHKMGGFEKLLMVAAGAFALSIKGVRNVALAGAGYYYLAKFFGKVDKPLKPFEKMATQGTSMFFNMPGVKEAREKLGITPNMTAQESIERGRVVSQFLSDDVKEDIDASTTGLLLLYDMPLNELAQYVDFVDVRGDGLSKGVLHTWDPNFQKRGRQILAARGVDQRAIERFFADVSTGPIALPPDVAVRLGVGEVTENALLTGDALASVYYLLGAKDSRFSADVQFVDAVRDEAGGSYDRIPDVPVELNGRTANPKQLFYSIARAGQENATSMTLGNFVTERMGLRNAPKSRAEAVDDARFMEKRFALESYMHMGKETKLSAKDRGNVVEIGQVDGLEWQRPIRGSNIQSPVDGYHLVSPITLSKDDFLRKSVDEIAEEWLKSALPTKIAELKEVELVKTKFSGLFEAKIDGDVVKYSPDPTVGAGFPEAETPKFAFMQAKSRVLAEKYNAWYLIPTPPTKDPLEL